MALDKKFPFLNDLNLDVIAVQECSERAVKSLDGSGRITASWFGKNPKKGLGIIVRQPWRISQVETLEVNLAARVSLEGPIPAEIYPVWACKVPLRKNYIGQIHLLLDFLEGTARHPNTVVMGDFNSNSIWDHEHGTQSHTSAVNRFQKMGIVSAYHSFKKERQGAEALPTSYFRKDSTRPYHIDYVFLSTALANRMMRVEAHDPVDWIKHSDHFPVVVELND